MTMTFDEICIDARDATALGAWWSRVLGWRQDVDSDGDVVLQTPPGAGPNWLFIAVPDDTIASMVCSTLRSLSVIPEFQEFQPIGGACGRGGCGVGVVHAASTPTQTVRLQRRRTRQS